ncbi:MAG: arsenate reductase [Spirosomataceae bacterium]
MQIARKVLENQDKKVGLHPLKNINPAKRMYKLYGIPNCDTVKKAIKWLEGHQIPVEFHDYKKKGVSSEKINEWLTQTTLEVLVNRKGTTWKNIPDAQKTTEAKGLIALMVQSPSVIKRPIVEGSHGIVSVGFSEAEYQEKFLKVS